MMCIIQHRKRTVNKDSREGQMKVPRQIGPGLAQIIFRQSILPYGLHPKRLKAFSYPDGELRRILYRSVGDAGKIFFAAAYANNSFILCPRVS